MRGAPDTPKPVTVGHDDIAYLQYTGGTTGVSKGAMLTHGNLVANVLQSRAWFKQVELDNTTYVCALPLYHIFSLTANCLLFTSLGGAGHLIANPRDFKGFVKELRSHPPMFFMGVNTLFNALMNTPGFECAGLLPSGRHRGRWHGRAARGRGALEANHRLRDHARAGD